MSGDATEQEATSTALVLEPNYFPCMRHGKQFYAPSMTLKARGGKAITNIKRFLPVSPAAYAGMLNSSAAASWTPYLKVTNMAQLEVKEGSVMTALFEVEGYNEATKQVFLIPPFDILSKHLPKLHAEVVADPTTAGVPISEEDEPSPKKRAYNQARIDSLLWKPTDCVIDKNGKGARPSRPDPQTNGWVQLPKEECDNLTEALAPLYDLAKATRPTQGGKGPSKGGAKGGAAGKRGAQYTSDDEESVLPADFYAAPASKLCRGDAVRMSFEAADPSLIKAYWAGGRFRIEISEPSAKKQKVTPAEEAPEEVAGEDDE